MLAVSRNSAPAGPGKIVVLGFNASTFYDTNIKDTQVVLQLWADKFAVRMLKDYRAKTVILDDLPAVINHLNREKIDIVQLEAVDYLKIKDKTTIDPVMVGMRHGRAGESFLLLVSKNSGIKSISDLKGKKLSIQPEEIAHMWLDMILLRKTGTDTGHYFKTVDISSKPANMVTRVYFNQTDACVVGRGAFDTAVELNPGIRSKVVILDESPRFLILLSCIRSDIEKEVRESFIDAALHMPDEPEGKQLLTIFRMDRIVRYEPEYLISVQKLDEELRAVRKKKGK